MSDLYLRDLSYFLQGTPPPPRNVRFRLAHARSLRDLSADARRALVQFQELCRAAAELETLLDLRPPRLEKAPPGLAPDALAQRQRQRLGLGTGPVENLRRALENEGLRVFEVPAPQGEFAGFSWWYGDNVPCVLLNARDPAGRRAFTLAHEYGHLLREDQPSLCDPEARLPEERFTNRFAACLLMPQDDLRAQCERHGITPTTFSLEGAAALARRYHVGVEAMGRRLEELGRIPQGAADALIRELSSRRPYYPRPASPRWRRQVGDTYAGRAIQAYSQGLISLSRLAQYLGVNVSKAFEIVGAAPVRATK
jgi:Zn-dependent peptidase ImmA (M78 family)